MMRVSSTASTLLLCISICLYPLVFGESVSENVNTTTEYFISNFCSAQSKGSGNENNSEGFTSLLRSASTLFFCSMKETIPPELMSNSVNKSSLPPVIRFVRTVFSWFLSTLTRKFPVDPLICDKPAGRIRMIRTLVHAVPTILGRGWLRAGVVSDKVCRAEEYGRSEALTCWHFVAHNTTCRNVTYARFVLNLVAMSVPQMALVLGQATFGLRLTKGLDDILENAVKAVLNSCWEPELRALLVVYKSHGKWDISPECSSILPQVCKRMVDKTMNNIFAIFKRKRQRYNISPASRVVGQIWKQHHQYIFTAFRILSSIVHNVLRLHFPEIDLPYVFTFCKDRFGEEC
eukprot:scpid68422/ scgid22432/ 